MSALTKNEREGLEDVFLSIQTNKNRYAKLKHISSLIMTHDVSLNAVELLRRAKIGIKETKLSHYLLNLTQKKKNLSK